MEMAVLCPQALILGAGDTVDVKGTSVAAQGSLWGERSWMTVVAGGVAP